MQEETPVKMSKTQKRNNLHKKNRLRVAQLRTENVLKALGIAVSDFEVVFENLKRNSVKNLSPSEAQLINKVLVNSKVKFNRVLTNMFKCSFEEHEVEKFVGIKLFQYENKFELKCKVRWVGYTEQHDTWELLSEMENNEMLDPFLEKLREKTINLQAGCTFE